MNNAIDFLSLFRLGTEAVLLDPDDIEVYSGTARQCIAWLMKNDEYDIFPENGGYWANVENNKVVLYLDEIVEESYKREAYDGQSFYKAIKNDFITAYCDAYGCSKREAEQTYKDCVREGSSGLRYMQAVVDEFKDNAKRTFYDD